MGASIIVLMKNEIRMLFNQFKRTITTPSLLMFYSVMFFGTLTVSFMITILADFAPLLDLMGSTLEGIAERDAIFGAIGIFIPSAFIAGYFGSGPASVFTTSDEYVLMPSIAKPYQLFISRYIKRFVRRLVYALLGFIVFIPLMIDSNVVIVPVILLVIAVLIFLEVSYFLGGLGFHIRKKLAKRIQTRARHIVVILFAILLYLPSLPAFIDNPYALGFSPANAFTVIVTELTGFLSSGWQLEMGFITLWNAFILTFLVISLLSDTDLYEEYASTSGHIESESRIIRLIRGQVDFSDSNFSDPMVWIILKDFWSKMRTPLQFYKYLYVVVGTILALVLNIFRPPWIPMVTIPSEFSFAAVPAYLLLLILFTQMASVPALMSFVEEKENIYLLRASPFKSNDIVLAKYLFSLFEIALISLPLYGFLLYFFRVHGSLFLTTLVVPLIIIFASTGVMIGAYVPVFTNDPKNPPVPLAFSFPVINLIIGAILMVMIMLFSHDIVLLMLLPIITISFVIIFLSFANRAIKSYK
ncbi:MAG: hypothetical protein GF411_04155 [Candidatus Lokiarchaeota archaeon]|nr:hypothetical protein [Candidatus Lokiarchaeota archaeon]